MEEREQISSDVQCEKNAIEIQGATFAWDSVSNAEPTSGVGHVTKQDKPGSDEKKINAMNDKKRQRQQPFKYVNKVRSSASDATGGHLEKGAEDPLTGDDVMQTEADYVDVLRDIDLCVPKVNNFVCISL